MNTRRQQRLASTIEQTIMLAISQGEIKDPRVKSEIVITEIDLARDMSQVKVYVGSYLSKDELERAVEGLNSASGLMRSILGRVLQTKQTPRPIFIMDERLKEGFYLGKKIVQANRAAGITEEDVKKAQAEGFGQE
ncbi:30S ribosome-binding factor RbfA [Entomospira culicis]|uniref:Ribosome-binding factor A n=1 Tax=Entomospira culicis TaxID=2719989 RepID=A0A968KVC3_9SPIO|nr:30S ribosome-binding factor RbfA [Entomospira culicis]NIZ18733.1 30S ribosome-binding factor RbfA [Entomospira culicis]NIZ68948.1 30S ribosome-binding factor RbfA [Entomospira culicis]WDI37540.1 30S ribosome-binding factor RbfA [Entomospira culicis]WDI39168.1 30S ribosome-binding factor RbfA [Entomospira culicis]